MKGVPDQQPGTSQQADSEQERDRRLRPDLPHPNQSQSGNRSRSRSSSPKSNITTPPTPGRNISPLSSNKERYTKFNMREKTKKSLYVKALLNKLRLEKKSSALS